MTEFPWIVLERAAYVASSAWPDRVSAGRLVEAIRATGVERNIVSSDLGQPSNPAYPDGLASFALSMVGAGLHPADLRRMLVGGPAQLLGLAPT